MNDGDDPYQILGVSSLATQNEIRAAYRKLALQHHPDKQTSPAAAERSKHEFARVSEAYELLSNETERQEYDQSQKGYARENGKATPSNGSKSPSAKGYNKKKKKTNFNDPYEVFKRQFEQQYGKEYPGAKFDNVDPSKLEDAKKLKGKDAVPQINKSQTIPNGTHVFLRGLLSQPQRNGAKAVVSQYDPYAGRYTVRLGNDFLKVKPGNLLQNAHVTLRGIESKPHLNGQRGKIVSWDDVKERYGVDTANSGTLSIKPGNAILEPKTVGRIVGISSNPALNGQYGTIVEWIPAPVNRYSVQLAVDRIVKIKVENLLV